MAEKGVEEQVLAMERLLIFCSQYVFEEWYDQLGGEASPLADAIIDRIAHDSYQINITSIDAEHDRSMREVYGLDKTLRE